MAEENILVVSGGADDRGLMQRFLTSAGYTVTTAASGTEALEACGRNQFALVLTDFRMPGMSGEELLERVKEVSPTTDVIIVTSYLTPESTIGILEAGASDYLLKPFKLAQLGKVVQRCLEQQRLARELDKERQLRQELEELNRANARLYREAEQRGVDMQRLSAELRQAQEGERRRIARDLHDGVAQTLSGLFMQLDLLDNLVESSPPAREYVGRIRFVVEQALTEVRELVWTLRPPILDDLGLPDALQGLVANLSQSAATEIALHIDKSLPPLLSAMETAIYRITQEALSNVFQHARASQVRVYLGIKGGALQLTVADNGQGIDSSTGGVETRPYPAFEPFDPSTGFRAGPARDRRGIGLWSMRERAKEVGGEFSLRSSPGQGTTILITFLL